MPLIGANGGLIGAARTSRRGAAVGVWTPNEQVIYQRQNAWIGDANFDSVSLLLHMDGSNGSTMFTDSSKNALAVTANGNAQISTAQSKFGGASAYFDGTGDSLSLSSNIGFAFGTGAFTLETYIYPTVNGSSGGSTLLDFRAALDANPWTLYIKNTGSGNFLGMYHATGTTFAEWGGTGQYLALNQWHHVALVSDGTTYKLFANGTVFTVSAGSASVVNLGTTSKPCRIGAAADGTTAPYAGYIDDLRITKGVARYTSNFTPSLAPFPDA